MKTFIRVLIFLLSIAIGIMLTFFEGLRTIFMEAENLIYDLTLSVFIAAGLIIFFLVLYKRIKLDKKVDKILFLLLGISVTGPFIWSSFVYSEMLYRQKTNSPRQGDD